MPSVDKRITEMVFDNKQFEKGIATSIKSLSKLEKSLQLDKAGQSLKDLERSMNNFRLEKMAQSIDMIASRFTVMGRVGMRALDNIVDSAMRAGKQLIRSLSIDQLSSGMSKYEQKAASIQTIMNATGKSMDDVSGYLDKLMWFSDETSYGFTDMTAALAQMTSSGGDIDSLIPMIMGVANATAFAGKGAAEFSRIMYNLNQSYGMGSLQYMDWKSVELAGAGSKQLKQVLIDTAVSMGKIKEGEVTLANFGETLKDKWADKSVMEQGFGKFAEFSEAVRKAVENDEYATAAKAIEAMADSYDITTVEAFKAAQTAKTFTEAIEATKDAVSSGWMRSFELILGNFEEAKALWTGVTNELWEIFAKGSEQRNQLLFDWKKLGGRNDLIRGLATFYHSLKKIGGSIKKAWTDVFKPIDDKGLASITKRFRDFSRRIFMWLHGDAGDGESRLTKITKAFRGLFSVLKIGINIFSAIAGGIKSVIGAFLPGGADAILRFLGDLGDKIFAFANDTDFKKIVDDVFGGIIAFLTPIVNTLGDYALILWNTISDLFGWGDGDKKAKDPDRKSLAKEVQEFFGGVQEVLGPIITAISDFGTLIWNTIADLFGFGPKQSSKPIKAQIERKSLAKDIQKFFGGITPVLAPIVSSVGQFSTKIWNTVADLVGLGPDKSKMTPKELAKRKSFAEPIKKFFGSISEALGPIWEKIKGFAAGIPGFFKNVATFVSGLYTYIKTSDRVKAWWTSIKTFFEPVIKALSGYWTKIKDFFANIFGFGKKDGVGKGGGGGGNAAVKTLQERFATPEGIKEYFDGLIDSVKTWFGKFKESLSEKWTDIKNFFADLFSGSKKEIDEDGMTRFQVFLAKLGNILKTVAEFLRGNWGWILAGVAIFKVGKFLRDAMGVAALFGRARVLNADGYEKFGNKMMKIAGAVALVAASIYILGEMDAKKLAQGAIAVGIIIGVLTTLSLLGGKIKIKSGIGMNMLGIAGAVFIIIMSIKSMMKLFAGLNENNTKQFIGAIGAVSIMLVSMVLLSKIMSGTNIKGNKHGWKSILAVAGSVWLIVQGLKPLVDISPEGLKQMGAGLLAIGGVIAGLVYVSNKSSGVGGGKSKISGVIGLALGMALLIHVLKPMAKTTPDELFNMGLVLGGISAVLAILMKSSRGMTAAGAAAAIGSLLALAGVLWVLGNSLRSIRGLNWQQILAFTGGVSAMIAALAIPLRASALSGISGGFGTLLGLVGVGGVIWSLGEALQKIPNIDNDKIWNFTLSVAMLTGVDGAIGLLGLLTKASGKIFLASGLGSLMSKGGLALVINEMGSAMAKIGEHQVNPEQMDAFAKGVAIMTGVDQGASILSGGILVALQKAVGTSGSPGAMKLLSDVGSTISKGGLALVINEFGSAMAAVGGHKIQPEQMEAFAKGVALMTGVDQGASILSGGILVALQKAVGTSGSPGAMKLLSDVGSFITQGGLALVINEFGSAMVKISEYNVQPEQMEAFAKGVAVMTGTSGIISMVTGIISTLGNGAGGIAMLLGAGSSFISNLGLSAVIHEFGSAMEDVGKYNVQPDQIEAFATGLSWLVGVNGVISAIQGFSPLGGVNAYLSGYGLGLVVMTLGDALSKIPNVSVETINAFTSGVTELVKPNGNDNFWKALSDTIGIFRGSNKQKEYEGLGSAIESVGNALAMVATAGVTEENVQLFMDTMGRVKSFVDGVNAQAGEDDNWGAITIGSSMAALADDISRFSQGVTDLSTALDGIKLPFSFYIKTFTAISAVKTVGWFLTQLKDGSSGIDLENLNWFERLWTDDNTTNLARHLKTFADGINKLAESFDGVEVGSFNEKAEESIAAVKKIADFLMMFQTTGKYGNYIGISDLYTAVSNFIIDLANLGGAIAQFDQSVSNVDTLKVTDLIDSITNFVSSIKDASTSINENVISDLGEHIKALAKTFTTTLTTEIGTEIQNGGGASIETPFKTVLTTIITNLNTFVQSDQGFRAVGINAASGLGLGLLDSSYLAERAARQVAQNMLQAAKDALGENSPSREFMQIGYFADEGMAIGLRQGLGGVTAAARSLGLSTIQAVNESLGIRSPSKASYNSMLDVGEGMVLGLKKSEALVVGAAKGLVERIVGVVKDGATIMSDTLDGLVGMMPQTPDEIKAQLEMYGFEEGFLPSKDGNKSDEKDKDSNNKNTNGTGNRRNTTGLTPRTIQNLCGTVGLGLSQSVQSQQLADRIEELARNMTNLKVVMNSGALVGEIRTDMDRQLGTMASQARRR